MIRYLLFALLLVVFTLALVFASVNGGDLTLDLAFTELETTVAFALLGFFAAGWLFGLASAALILLKTYTERRRLRKSLRLAEAEVSSLRRMPSHNAD